MKQDKDEIKDYTCSFSILLIYVTELYLHMRDTMPFFYFPFLSFIISSGFLLALPDKVWRRSLAIASF